MDIVVFSGQSNFTTEISKIIEKRHLQNTCLVIESAGPDTERLGQYYFQRQTKVFIARGQNYEILKKFDIPVVNVRCTYEEILVAYRKARKISSKIGILGFGSIYDMIKKFKTTSHADITPIEIIDVTRSEELVKEGITQGIEVFVGGISTKKACKKLGVPQVTLEIDHDSLNIAISDALHLVAVQTEKNRSLYLIQALLDSASEAIVSFDQNQKINYQNAQAKKIIRKNPLGYFIQSIFDEESQAQVFQNGQDVCNKILALSGESYVLRIEPLKSKNIVYGAVAYLNAATNLISSENTLRKKLYAKGHVAKSHFEHIIGESGVIQTTIEWAKKIAQSDNTVLISGESGTGKELFAQSIHNASPRKDGPFIAINCASLAGSVLDSELFGYVHGAFTGANPQGKTGIFELAHHGTVFLDEISEISTDVQAKLLRVLQEKEVIRIGDEKVTPIDVRVITATNKNLYQLCLAGSFRNDLFYRLAVLELTIPPLSDRKDDIPLIAANYLNQHYPGIAVNETCLAAFTQFSYPGNVRHLINIIERCIVMSDERMLSPQTVQMVIGKEKHAYHSAQVQAEQTAAIFSGYHEDEAIQIQQQLRKNFGNRKKTAADLGISTTTLWRKLKKYHLFPEDT